MVLRKVIALVAVSLASHFLYAQDYEGDYIKSVKRTIKELEADENDSIRTSINLVKLSELYADNALLTHAYTAIDLALLYSNNERDRLLEKKKALQSATANGEITKMISDINEVFKLINRLQAEIGVKFSNYLGFINSGIPLEVVENNYKLSIELYEQTGRTRLSEYLEAIISLARFYLNNDRIKDATNTFTKAYDVNKKLRLLSGDKQQIFENEVISCYIKAGKIKDADKILGKMDLSQMESSTLAITLNNFVDLCIYQKKYEKSKDYLQQAIPLYRYSLPEYSSFLKTTLTPEFISRLNYTAGIYDKAGYKDVALKIYKEIYESIFRVVGDHIPYMLPTDRAHLWLLMKTYFNDSQQFVYSNPGLQDCLSFLYENNQLQRKVFLLPPFDWIDPMVLHDDNKIRYLWQKMDSLALSEATYNTRIGKGYIAKLKNDILQIAFSRDYIGYLKANRMVKSVLKPSWKGIRQALDAGEVFIEFLELKTTNDGVTEYGALIGTNTDEQPRLIKICKEDQLQLMINDSDDRAGKLDKLFWKLIQPHIDGAVSLYISPTGLVNTISFAELKQDGEYLVNKYNLYYLLRSEDILKKNKTDRLPPLKRNIHLFGGAHYGIAPKTSNPKMRGQQGFHYLSGSKHEIDAIADFLKSRSWSTVKYVGKEASENNIKRLSRQPNVSVIHISTHGFYLPYDFNTPNGAINRGGKSGYYEPMIRSGLIMTGGNVAWTKELPLDMENDCLFTAYEMALMQLPFTELVVLSACNTGTGDIRDGEGVFGMQQTLRLAGVKSMILSLTEVPDVETAELMTLFYGFWEDGLKKKDALLKAQRAMSKKYPNEPGKWAGFIYME